jgi:UPF0755 protein
VTDLLDLDAEPPPARRRRRRRRQGIARTLAVLVVLALTAALVWGGLVAVRTVFGSSAAEDYPGPGRGEVVVQVSPGDTAGDVADTLAAEDVVASRQAFFEVAAQDERSTSLQPGFYRLKERMRAADALELLLDPSSRVVGRVTVPEGLTVAQTLETLAAGTDIPLEQYQAAAKDVGSLGLPDYAQGQLEGFLFPATYDIEPGTTPTQVLSLMVDRFEQAAETVDLVAGAERLGYTPYEIVIVASLIEREVKKDDEYPKVARVVYNRLEQGIPLGIDASILYGVGKTAGGEVTAADLAADTPYENRRRTGLPPTPIAAPGEATLRGALNPVDSDILYYVLASKDGTTFFTNDYQEFLDQRDKSRAEGVF